MLNLSDKDLDRLSREAASEHDPGDIVGPRSWDKLEIRLDRHLGHVTPRPVRGFYRLPFYYAPVVLLLLGASYYFIRNHKTQKEASSGSPPLTLVKPAPTGADKPSISSQNPTQTDKSTSTLVLPPATSEQPIAPAAGAGPGHDLTSGGSATSASSANSAAPANSSARSAAPATGSPATSSTGTASSTGTHFVRHHLTTHGNDRSATSSPGSSNGAAGLSASSVLLSNPRTKRSLLRSTVPSNGLFSNASTPGSALPGTAPPSGERLLPLSTVRGPVPTKRPASVSDSALRAFTVKSIPTPIQRKGGLYINRSLQIGVLAAPDFSSVSSMSGDKPGSTIGLTADYQFAHRWYVGSGLLLSRKNYAAAPPNFHVPKDYDNMPYVNFVKGSFNMLEIPLNLRYDFSVTGNTMFFATAGLSSYVLTTESCNYYYQGYQPFSRQTIKSMHYANQPDYWFSALNLSMGVEMGINNSMSVIVAPYVKVPVRNMGFGQVQLSSVGINFIFEFTPVLSRSR